MRGSARASETRDQLSWGLRTMNKYGHSEHRFIQLVSALSAVCLTGIVGLPSVFYALRQREAAGILLMILE